MKRIPTLLLIALFAAQLPASQDLVYVRVSAVSAATVGNGRPVKGLRKEEFKVFEDNVPQDIVSVSEERLPLDVGILFDDSSTAKSDARAEVLSGLNKFSGKDGEFFLMESGRSPLINQYQIGYRSINKSTDGKWRKIKITAEYVDKTSKKAAKLNIHAKPGYYAPAATK